MDFKVYVGESDFASLRENGAYYVDKTRILYELIQDTTNKVTLFTRPRRFGKTLMMSMMENFFNIRKDSKELFEGLAVSENKEFCDKWMNKYPVLFISFKDIEGLSFEGAYGMLKYRIAEVCSSVAEIAEIKGLEENLKRTFSKLWLNEADMEEIKGSLKSLMKVLYKTFNKKVILLIDEYDVPLAKAGRRDLENGGYYKDMLDVIRSIIGAALKDNEFLERAVITGCLRIAKESIFTGTNNFASYSVIDMHFSNYFGFTQEEVDDMLEAADLKGSANVIKEWYNGYIFGETPVYCPWDVINHISELRFNRNTAPKNYWKNTSHNDVILSFVERTDLDVSDKFETLMNGGTIEQTISDTLTYDTIFATEDNLWSVLFMTGYVTKADPKEEGDTVHLRIPNKEIATIFYDTVAFYFRENLDTDKQSALMDALWSEDEARATEIFSDLLWDTISYMDYHEDYYHAFLAGIFVGRGYGVESNKEHGLGRPDIKLKDKKKRRALVIEAKKADSQKAMDRMCDEALKQIVDGEYGKGFEGYRQVSCYGVAFFQKKAKVKLLK